MALTLIGHAEVTGASQAALEFTSIAGDFDDLLLVCSVRSTYTPDTFVFVTPYINGSSNNTGMYLYGWNGGTFNAGYGIGVALGANGTSTIFSNNRIYLSDYASTTRTKVMGIEGYTGGTGTSGSTSIASNHFNSTTAITSFGIVTSGNFVQFSTATLYGVTNGSDGIVTVT